MSGRGRERGKSATSILDEQLGITKETQPPQVLHPPPKFPPLLYKPIPFGITTELSYLFELKRDYAETMRESEYYVQPNVIKKDREGYSDRYMMIDTTGYESRYDWTRMPGELRPFGKKPKAADSHATCEKKKKEVNVEEKLKELEKKETSQPSDVEEDAKEEEEAEEKDPDEVLEDDEEVVDEEMYDGTDYASNYFDNGEGYDEEEDNNDDGPVF